MRIFEYYYQGTKPVRITFSTTEAGIVNPGTKFKIHESFMGELKKLTEFGMVRFVGMQEEQKVVQPVQPQPQVQPQVQAQQAQDVKKKIIPTMAEVAKAEAQIVTKPFPGSNNGNVQSIARPYPKKQGGSIAEAYIQNSAHIQNSNQMVQAQLMQQNQGSPAAMAAAQAQMARPTGNNKVTPQMAEAQLKALSSIYGNVSTELDVSEPTGNELDDVLGEVPAGEMVENESTQETFDLDSFDTTDNVETDSKSAGNSKKRARRVKIQKTE